MRKIRKIEPTVPVIKPKKKVAAYARVSMESERLMHSLSQQISYYSSKIQKNPDWTYVGVYADEGITGTIAKKRDEFQRMIADCEAGKIDIILTKSISRFARNTVDLLETVRHLKDLGVEVRFEEQNINTMNGDGELMLTILASFAQEEVRSLSDNVKWGVRKRFKEGIAVNRPRMLGYRWEDDQLVIVPEEAEIVKRIFQNFLDGKSRLETERELDAEGLRSINGCKFTDSQLKVILTNITYTGNTLLQKEFIEDPITKKRKHNKGELPKYFIEDTHEPIISMETYKYVQDEMARRRELGPLANKALNTTVFTGKIKCGCCGLSYVHNLREDRCHQEFWTCADKKKKNSTCPSIGSLPHKILLKECAAVMELEEFDETTFQEQIDTIVVPKRNTLIFKMKDGREIRRDWVSTAKRDYWTDDKKEKQKVWMENYMAQDDTKFSAFTTRVKCGVCGGSCRRATQPSKYEPGGKAKYWRCGKGGCGVKGIREDELENLSAKMLGIESFDGDVFRELIDHITMQPNGTLEFTFSDGRSESTEYAVKRVARKWTEERRAKTVESIRNSYTEERRQKMSENMKRIRAERYWSSKGGKANGAKSNSDSGND